MYYHVHIYMSRLCEESPRAPFCDWVEPIAHVASHGGSHVAGESLPITKIIINGH